MTTNATQKQIRKIYQMLFEMATGNFSFKIEETNENTELDNIAKTLNALAGKMQKIILGSGYINPYYTYQNLVQLTFILDSDFQITSFSPNLSTVLEYNSKTLYKTAFSTIIANQSIPVWKILKEQIKQDKNYHTTIQLIFIDNQQQVIPSFCTIYRLCHSDKIFISSVTTILQDITANNSKATARKSDAIIIQEVYEYIMGHLEEPLPTLKELSHIFGTNEFKLKDGFRHFFKTSIYKFYTKQRLKQAHALIQQTNLPLKEIAYMSGFNDYTNFSKAFKKQYHYPPSDLKRVE